MDVRLPDGRVIRGVPEGTTKAQLAAKLQAAGHEVPKEWFTPAQPQYRLEDTIPLADGTLVNPDGTPYQAPTEAAQPAREGMPSLGDPVLDMWLSGLGTAVKGAPEAIATMLNNALVTAGTGFEAVARHPLDNDAAADFTNQALDERLYRPQGEDARELLGGLSEAVAPIERGKEALGEATLEATGSPALATGAHMLPDTLMSAAGMRPAAGAIKKVDEAIAPKAAEPVSPAVENLRAGGIELRPSDIRAMHPELDDIPGEFREKFSNPADLKQSKTLANQATLTKHAAEELGVKDLTDTSLAGAEAPHLKTYQLAEDVAGSKPPIPEFDAALREAIDAVKVELPRGEKPTITRVLSTLRDKARRLMKADNQESNNQGFAARNMADALEEAFGKQLEAVGEPQLLQQYRDARQSLGRIYDVWDSKRADQIDAAALKRLNDKHGGKRLSGRLKFIADAAEFAPNVTKHSLSTASRAGEELPATREGVVTRGTKWLMRQIPGVDVGRKAFQESLGAENPARITYGGAEPPVFEPVPPQQGGLDLRQVLGLEPPEGAVGRPPLRPAPAEQPDMLGEAFDLERPSGRAGTRLPSDPRARTRGVTDVRIGDEPLAEPRTNLVAEDLSEVLGLSEPLVKPGKKPRRK